MTGLKRGDERPTQSREPGPFSSARRNVQARINARPVLLAVAASIVFLVIVGLVLYFKPGSTVEPSGEPSLDVFAAGPVEEFEAGMVRLYKNEHFFLVRMPDGGMIALYDLGPASQARIARGEIEADECRAVLREDEAMAGWLAAAGAPEGFADRGIWDECAGVAWDVTGEPVFGPAIGTLDRFTVEVHDGIIRVDLDERVCLNPVTPQAPCIETQ
jgi:hypothetical protein